MNFRTRLHREPLLAEVIPPKLGATPAQIEQALQLVGGLLKDESFDAVNVPEILGSGFQSMDALDFGELIHRRYGVDVVVNKVVVHHPRSRLVAWIDRVLASPIASTILVGGERSGIYYPGPNVTEANRLMRERAEAAGRNDFPIGNVTLPSRPREALRMAEKARSGCDYFASQIIYESGSANAHLQAYADVCELGGVPPKPVLYAFSPAENPQDVLFLRYLGVHIPPEVEEALFASPANNGTASLTIIHQLWSKLLEMARERSVSVPLGAIVETVSRHNTAAALALAAHLRQALKQPPNSPVSPSSSALQT